MSSRSLAQPMGALAHAPQVERFRDILERRLGLALDDARLDSLAESLRRRVTEDNITADVYLARLAAEAGDTELLKVVGEVTVGETYFFRHLDQLRAFAEVALPERVRWASQPRAWERERAQPESSFPGRLRILSAGCSTGEEAYSLAMLAHEAIEARGAQAPAPAIQVLGVDVNVASLERARRGRFAPWALRETPAAMRSRWFRSVGREIELDVTIRTAVEFAPTNLAAGDESLWLEGAFDIVFCRNVLMYFSRERAAEVVARFARSLAPGGYLFLGHAETLRDLSTDFDLCHSHDAFYHRRIDGAPRPPPRGPALVAPFAAGPIDLTSGWVDAIGRSSERIQALGESTAPGPRLASSIADEPTRPDFESALGLIGQERYVDALELVDAWPRAGEDDADTLLLRSMLLTHQGRFAEAADASLRLLSVDPGDRPSTSFVRLGAGAHYLLALCREGEGDFPRALAHHQAAADLDPTFAMPRLHLGLLANRAGDRDAACRELGRALALLRREDEPRLLFFGGGFGRESLVALCRAQLVACGGSA